MYISSPQIEVSAAPGRIRLFADVSYDHDKSLRERYWFDFDEAYTDEVNTSGDPWLACMIPLAMTLGEDLTISAPIDPLLLDNVHELMGIWKCWFPGTRPIKVQSEYKGKNEPSRGGRTGAFFSGGVDSFFTILRHEDISLPQSRFPVDDLVLVWGFDIPIAKPDEFLSLKSNLGESAVALNKNLVDVATNLRDPNLMWRTAKWGPLAHGGALASVALCLSTRYSNMLIGSSAGYERLHPWGSHPLTDPLYSNTHTKIIHDGGSFSRTEKTEYICANPIVRKHLHVCWKHGTSTNCSKCAKCYRTMTNLLILNVLEEFDTFQEFDIDDLSRLFVKNETELSNFRMLRELAAEKNLDEVVKEIDKCIDRSKRTRKIKAIFDKAGHFPILGRVSSRLSGILPRPTIT